MKQQQSDINHNNFFFLDLLSKVTEIKTIINKWDLSKLKSFHKAKETINEVKRQLTPFNEYSGLIPFRIALI